MNSKTHPKSITISDLKSKTQSYAFSNDTKFDSSLADLDTFRYTTLPAKLDRIHDHYQQTRPTETKSHQNPSAHVTKSDLKTLTEWKLKHGTFRPRLLALVSSNPEEVIESVTASAFETYTLTPPRKTLSHDDRLAQLRNYGIIKSLTQLTTLKGVGPATASLILSCFDPVNVPFFSDELFRWLHFEGDLSAEANSESQSDQDQEQPSSKRRRTAKKADTKTTAAGREPKKTKAAAGSEGWQRKIKYSMKEYRSLLERWDELRQRLGDEEGGGGEVRADEVEKAAWVMFREEEGAGREGEGVKGKVGKRGREMDI